MKTDVKPYLWAALAVSLLSWAALEFLLLVTQQFGVQYHAFFAGAVVGGVLGSLLAGMDGFLSQAPNKIKAGLKFGGAIGAFGGALGFYLLEQIALRFGAYELSAGLEGMVYAQRWLVLGIFIGAAYGAVEQSNRVTTRNIIAGLFAGVGATLINGLVAGLITYPFVLRGLNLVVFTLLFLMAHRKLRTYKREQWLLSMNGKHEGAEFELNKPIYYLGTQSNDDINLDSYEQINSTHAKLIKFDYGYSLVDNDPFCRTFVNFRNINEQPLKNGDVIKIGTALFQYCSLA
ncbi:MAG: FHA domain-containing protein [bacterium]|nr:FHA domain-containing protein [bacterium]